MKKKWISLLVTIALVFTMVGCGGGSGESNGAPDGGEQVYQMKISHLTTEIDSMHLGALEFKKILEEKSGGRIQVEIFPNKILANSDNEMLEQVRNNTVQMCITPNFIVAATNSELKHPNIFDFPYMFETPDELYAFCDSDMGKAIDSEILKKSGGIKTYGPYTPSWYKIGTTKTPINSMGDLKGLKLRTTTSEMAMAAISAFGANPTPINYGEVFTALQQGTVVGNISATNLYVTERYYEVVRNMAVTNHVAHILYPCLSAMWYDSLPGDLKTAVDESMVEYLAWIRDYGKTVEEDSLAELEAQGVNIKYLSGQEKQEFIDAGKKTWEPNAGVAGGQDYIDQVQAFLEDYRANR